MLDKETYLNVLTRYFDSIREDFDSIYNREDSDESVPNCTGVSCGNCMFNNSNAVCPRGYGVYNTLKKIEEWSNKHPYPEYKVSQFEYDILKAHYDNVFDSVFFSEDRILMPLLEKGYFKGATEKTVINCYFLDCGVANDNG